jgi:hypothetical protein
LSAACLYQQIDFHFPPRTFSAFTTSISAHGGACRHISKLAYTAVCMSAHSLRTAVYVCTSLRVAECGCHNLSIAVHSRVSCGASAHRFAGQCIVVLSVRHHASLEHLVTSEYITAYRRTFQYTTAHHSTFQFPVYHSASLYISAHNSISKLP